MAKKPRSRRLWLKIKYSAPGSSPKTVIRTLLKSIDNGDYEYPARWRVALLWSNKENGELRAGEWTKEMTASAQSSEGFEFAVRSYLEGQL
jgi:hypothetical protein